MDLFDILLAKKLGSGNSQGVAVYKGSVEFTIPDVGETETISVRFQEELLTENYVPIIYNMGAHGMACPVLVNIFSGGFDFMVQNVGDLETPGDIGYADWCVILIPESEG